MAIGSTEIPERIKFFRKLRGITQEELSKASGINFGLIRKYECGERCPKLEQLQSIASALSISLDTLLDFDINTTGDVMSILIRLDEKGCVDFSGRKNKDGSYKPSSVCVSFKSEELCSLIANYMCFRERISSESDVLLKAENSDLPLQIEKTKFMLDDTTL